MCYVCWWLVASFSNSWRHASLASYICDSYGCFNNIVFNTKKTTCSVVGNVRHNDVLLFLNNQKFLLWKLLNIEVLNLLHKILYMLMFHSLRENSMLPAMVYLINVEDHVKLFKSIWLALFVCHCLLTPLVLWNFPSVLFITWARSMLEWCF